MAERVHNMKASMRPHLFRRGNAIAVIWKMLMVVEKRFRRLSAPDMMKAVYDGGKYKDGIAILATEEVGA